MHEFGSPNGLALYLTTSYIMSVIIVGASVRHAKIRVFVVENNISVAGRY